MPQISVPFLVLPTVDGIFPGRQLANGSKIAAHNFTYSAFLVLVLLLCHATIVVLYSFVNFSGSVGSVFIC